MGVAERPLLLALRALGLGDLLTGVPALRALRRAFPEHEIALAMPPALEPLALLSGSVDRVLPAAPLARLGGLRGRPDLAVNLHGRGPQSHRVLLATRPRRLVAFAHPEVPESRGMPAWRAEEPEVRRWCRLLGDALGVDADPLDLRLPPPAGVAVPEVVRDATLIHPGAAFAARRWPVERWAEVARAEQRAGRSVVVTGGPGEVGLAQRLAHLAGLDDGHVLAGRTGPLQLAAVVAAAARVVCGDTGVAHLATAMGTPSVVLFGPVSPELWGPPPELTIHRILWKGRRRGDPHGAEPDPGLLDIAVAEVVEALDTLPGRDAGPGQAPVDDSSSRRQPSSAGGTARRSRSTQGSPRAASSSPPRLAARS